MPHRNVLVVEDDDNIRELLLQHFKEYSEIDVDGARDGVEALHHVAAKHYSVVILDLMMPHMSGVDFLDSLKALDSDPSLKSIALPPAVVVITSAPAETIPSGEIEGRFPSLVRNVLRKPFDLKALAGCVESLL